MTNKQSQQSSGETSIVRQAIAWTVAFELLTCALRFGAGLESTRDTASTIGQLTMGVRIHHSYIGLIMLPIAMLIERRWPRGSRWISGIGLGLLFSDLIHHFLVLWLITGSPQFDLLY